MRRKLQDNVYFMYSYLSDLASDSTEKNDLIRKSRQWLEKAAHQGFSEAQCTLGLLYFQQALTTTSTLEKKSLLQLAHTWVEKAFLQGNETTHFELDRIWRYRVSEPGMQEYIKEAFLKGKQDTNQNKQNNHCAKCGTTAKNQCSRCGLVNYCSKKCQKENSGCP